MKSILTGIICCLLLITAYSPALYAGPEDRAAILFIESEHKDDDEDSSGEVMAVYTTELLLASCYNKFYWLVNKTATRDNFIETVRTAVNEYTTVDIYTITHGGMQYFWGHYEDRIYTDDILGLESFENMDHLRYVYVGHCHGWDFTDEYIEAGAISSTGCMQLMDNSKFYPLFISFFGPGRMPLLAAVSAANFNLPVMVNPMIISINGDATLTIGRDND